MKAYQGALTLALALFPMILRSESNGLAIRGVDPALKSSIAKIGDNRPVILAKANFASYSNVAAGFVTVMSFTFPPLTLAPGDQIRVSIGGIAQNNTGANLQIGAVVQVSQGSVLGGPIYGNMANSPNTGVNAFAWMSEIRLSVGVPGAQATAYVPSISANAVTDNSTYSSGLQPNSAIYIMGVGGTIITDNSTSGGVNSGGLIRAPAAGTGPRYAGNFTPQVMDNSYPITFRVLVFDVSPVANAFVMVNAGSMEGL